uniref:Uncharacterized protein n=1 Tax=Anguilla anguilla TaxID=7936 RepID=A0A0E9PAW8_ANGAN
MISVLVTLRKTKPFPKYDILLKCVQLNEIIFDHILSIAAFQMDSILSDLHEASQLQ